MGSRIDPFNFLLDIYTTVIRVGVPLMTHFCNRHTDTSEVKIIYQASVESAALVTGETLSWYDCCTQ